MTTFADRCRVSTALPPDARDSLVEIEGAQHVVLIGGSLVWRFPRRTEDCDRIAEMAQRIRVAAGLGAPRVIEVVAGAPGACHLVLTRVAGTSLLRAQAAGRRVDGAVLGALRHLRGTTTVDWPFPQVDWVDMWSGLVTTAHARAALLPPDQVSALLEGAEAAAAVAATAPIRIVHGDLASDNIMVADDERLAGILDWDGAILGDPAIDTAAALHVLDPVVQEAAVAADPDLAADLRRWIIYRDTWTLQNLLWKQGLTPPLWGGTGH